MPIIFIKITQSARWTTPCHRISFIGKQQQQQPHCGQLPSNNRAIPMPLWKWKFALNVRFNWILTQFKNDGKTICQANNDWMNKFHVTHPQTIYEGCFLFWRNKNISVRLVRLNFFQHIRMHPQEFRGTSCLVWGGLGRKKKLICELNSYMRSNQYNWHGPMHLATTINSRPIERRGPLQPLFDVWLKLKSSLRP